MKFNFSKKEVMHLVFSILLLTVIISFSLASSFIEIIRILLIITISLLATAFFQKLIGLKYDQKVEFRIWALKESKNSSKKTLDKIKNIFNTYTGLIIPTIIFILTSGLWAFLSVASFTVINGLKPKLGREFLFLEEKKVATIAFFSILSYLFIALILYIITGTANLIETKIPLLLALYSLIPISNLPGAKLFFGSRTTYFFSLGLTLSLFVLLPVLPLQYSLIISILFALIIAGLYLYAIEAGIKRPFSLEEPTINIGWKILFVIILLAIMFLLMYFSEAKIITILALSIIFATLITLIYSYLIKNKK